MANVYWDDVGTELEIGVKDNGQIVPLDGASVKITLKKGSNEITSKDTIIKDTANGIVSYTIKEEGEFWNSSGNYTIYPVVTWPADDQFPNGRKFTADKININIS